VCKYVVRLCNMFQLNNFIVSGKDCIVFADNCAAAYSTDANFIIRPLFIRLRPVVDRIAALSSVKCRIKEFNERTARGIDFVLMMAFNEFEIKAVELIQCFTEQVV